MIAMKKYIALVEPNNIPVLLKSEKRWVAWRAGPLKPNGKFDKFPVDLVTGRKLNGRDPKHWRTFAEVMDAYDRGVAVGIGFALSDKHPIIIDGVNFYVTVLDFDQCGTKMESWRALWRELGEPFTEVSPSNKGLHMWGLSRSPLRGGNAGEGRELYSGGRFITMTGVGAKGAFGECPGFTSVEQQWFPERAMHANVPPPPPMSGSGDFPSNLVLGPSGDNWFERLSPENKNACLAEMLQVPAVIALADQEDNVPSPNWRTVLAACSRSGAPDAENLCRGWAKTSERYDSDDFDLRWGSYARG